MAVVLAVDPGPDSLRLAVVSTRNNRVLGSAQLPERPTGESTARVVSSLLGQAGGRRPTAVGYRLVHGGPDLLGPTPADDRAVAAARRAVNLAPAELPVTLAVLAALRELLPDVPHVFCPDTAFHRDLPEIASTYPVPVEWRREHGLRRYGSHGLSYAWAVRRAVALLGKPAEELNLLVAHLDGGCSVCAVRGGTSVDTTMGFTPLEGLPMSQRSGSVDPGMLLWLLREEKMSVDELSDGLYRRSGVLGLSDGRSADPRDLVAAAAAGDGTARLALGVFTRRTSQALAAMAVSLPGVDALVFTGAIGWDQPEIRAAVCADLRRLGVPHRLAGNLDRDGFVSPPHAPVPVLLVQPRPELQIAAETAALLAGSGAQTEVSNR